MKSCCRQAVAVERRETMRFTQTAMRERRSWGPLYRRALTLAWTFVQMRAEGRQFSDLLPREDELVVPAQLLGSNVASSTLRASGSQA